MSKWTSTFLLVTTVFWTIGANALPRLSFTDISKINLRTQDVEIVGRITATAGSHFVLSDGTNSIYAILSKRFLSPDFSCGDTISMDAIIVRHEYGSIGVYAKSIRLLRHEPIDVMPAQITLRDLSKDEFNFRTVSVTGTITDVFKDEIDPNYTFLTLETDDAAAVIYHCNPTVDVRQFSHLIDREVRVTGICRSTIDGYRQRMRYPAMIIDPHTAIERLRTVSAAGFPHRKGFSGNVLAAIGPRAFYLQDNSGERIKVYLEADADLPENGRQVSASGFVRRNIFFTTLSNAAVSVLPECTETAEDALAVSPYEILYDEDGKRKMKVRYEGRPIRITGIVTSVSDAGTPDGRITLSCDGIAIPVRIGALPPPPIAATLQASGICSIATESDGNLNGFVRLTGFSLLTRGPDDLIVLRQPPWWTPVKLLSVIAALLLLVVGILIWNKSLRTLAERRGRELMDEQLGRVAADLKVNERTRLAVELHDALSQNLTGVSLQLDAVKRFADEDRGKTARHLDMAMRTLKSCRDELRNCLWDLRNRALEETDMNEAIRRTASPFVGDAALLIRFNVPRDQISDNTAHALMRIIRELATNAVRHGAAKTIRIAGVLENGRLLFSVSDDGCGFDPQRHPGVDEGHFGLDGIRDRVSRFDGTLEIESTAGNGATIRISMTA